MVNVIVAFPNQKDAAAMANLLARHGYSIVSVCTSGSNVIQVLDSMEDSEGIIISGIKLHDMAYNVLLAELPDMWHMAVVASRMNLEHVYERNVIKLAMPLKSYDLFNMMEALERTIARQRKKRREKPKERSSAERAVLENAKSILMTTKNMTELEAHRYIQKCSMNNGTNLVETAQMVIEIYSQN